MGFQVEEDCCKRQVFRSIKLQPDQFQEFRFGFIFIKLTAQNLCSVSIIKRGICCNPFLGPHKIYIKIYSQRRLEKIIGGRSAQKMVGKVVNKVKNTKIGFLTVYS
jgi:hypothetical protein